MDNKRTQNFSRILLTIVVLVIMSPALWFVYAGLWLYGIGLLIAGIIALFFIWRPKGNSS